MYKSFQDHGQSLVFMEKDENGKGGGPKQFTYHWEVYRAPHEKHQCRQTCACTSSNWVEALMMDTKDLIPAVACSAISSSYTIRRLYLEHWLADQGGGNDGHDSFPQHLNAVYSYLPDLSAIASRLASSPGFITLGAGLVLGLCVSTYFERQAGLSNPIATTTFLCWVSSAACVGMAIGADFDAIVLGLVPWALCAAMASTSAINLALRWRCERYSVGDLLLHNNGA